jgi:ABC-2 type transport system permease protein
MVILLVFPWAADFEMKNINLNVVDNDHSAYSSRLIRKITASGYFRLAGVSSNYKEALAAIESDKADVILEIPANFEKDLGGNRNARVMISANTVNGTKGGMSSYYLMDILNDFSGEVREQWGGSAGVTLVPQVEIVPQFRYNPFLNYKVFMVPALMVMVMTMLCGFLPALNIVMEKEAGTIEQINVTPISRFTFILAKLIPFWIIGIIVVTIGSEWLTWFMDFTREAVSERYTLFNHLILAISGFGLIISNIPTPCSSHVRNLFFMLIFIILSGLFTPINSMPGWAQTITWFNPLKYFMQVMPWCISKQQHTGTQDATVRLLGFAAALTPGRYGATAKEAEVGLYTAADRFAPRVQRHKVLLRRLLLRDHSG